jgi:hypothetical protein
MRKWLLLSSAIASVLGLAFGVFVIERLAEPAMTSCGGVVPGRLQDANDVVITVETRMFPPWKYDCVFTRDGHVVARAHAPYP